MDPGWLKALFRPGRVPRQHGKLLSIFSESGGIVGRHANIDVHVGAERPKQQFTGIKRKERDADDEIDGDKGGGGEEPLADSGVPDIYFDCEELPDAPPLEDETIQPNRVRRSRETTEDAQARQQQEWAEYRSLVVAHCKNMGTLALLPSIKLIEPELVSSAAKCPRCGCCSPDNPMIREHSVLLVSVHNIQRLRIPVFQCK